MAIAIQVHTEAPSHVHAHAIGERVALSIGTDVTGVIFMGDISDVRQVIAQALERLSELERP
jgi:hypothetical protein